MLLMADGGACASCARRQALGMALPYSSSTPADDELKKEECRKAAVAVRSMLEKVGQETHGNDGVGCLVRSFWCV